MISNDCIAAMRAYALKQSTMFGKPKIFHVNLSVKKGIRLARVHRANKKIVELGTLLMDCMLGKAFQEQKLQQHAETGAKKAEQLLRDWPEITEKERNNVLCCIREHHGVTTFSSIESEICCNADCYRFISIEGVLGGIGSKNDTDSSIQEIAQLYSKKADEKWKVLTFDLCKKELEEQYFVIKKFLSFII